MPHCALLTLIACCLAAGPTTKPTAPATQPARVRDGLVNGSVRFLVPPDWEITQRTPDGMQVWYSQPGEKGIVSMMVTQQKQGIPVNDPVVRQQMAKWVLEMLNADLKKRNVEVIDAPKVEEDARFMLRVHERFRDGDAVIDAVHLYRGIGLNLVSVRAALTSEEKDEAGAKVVHDDGAQLLLSVNLGPQNPKMIRPVKKE